MLLVVPFCHKDAKKAVKLLDWMFELDGRQERHRCLAVGAKGIDDGLAKAVEAAAYRAFVTSKMVRTLVEDERGWPLSCNTLFTCAATYIRDTLKCPFWWNEPDCVPLKPGWLNALEDEYNKARRPFMGSVVTRPCKHLTGCALYPPDIPFYHPRMLGMHNQIAWDLVEPDITLQYTHHTNLFQHYWDDIKTAKQATFPEDDSLSLIRDDAVVFHRNKDLTLIDRLRERMTAPEITIPDSDFNTPITVVITNFQRPEFLWSAFESCLKANVKNIVVSSSGTTHEVEKVHHRIKSSRSDVVIVSETGDSGCNRNWMAGIQAAKSKWVTILHDDDLLLPDYGTLHRHFNPRAGFYLWDARRHGMGFDDTYPTLQLKTGTYLSCNLFRNLLVPNSYTLSPTIGCFQRDDLLETLSECDRHFGPEWHVKPTMMVGNDLMIWLRSIQKHKWMGYVKKNFTSYGHHEDSTTCRDVFKKEGKLAPIYNRTRSYFAETFRKIIHVVPAFHANDSETSRRNKHAESTWANLRLSGLYIFIPDCIGTRTSEDIGDKRSTPFLKDVLKAGLDKACPGDIILLTNNDTVLHPDTTWYILDMLREDGACCAFRQSYSKSPVLSNPLHLYRANGKDHDMGRDLFAFSKEWLDEHWDSIPDYVLGSSDWDSTLATLIRKTKGISVTEQTWIERDERCELPVGLVWHENHHALWSTPTNRVQLPGNVHNRRLTKEWIAKHGIGWFI